MCGGATAWRPSSGKRLQSSRSAKIGRMPLLYDHLRLVNQISLVRWNQGDFLHSLAGCGHPFMLASGTGKL